MRCYGMNSTQPKGMLVEAWKWKSGIQCIQGILLNTSDLWSGTLSLLGILLHSLLWSQNWIPTSSILLASLLFSFSSFYQPITSNVDLWCVYLYLVGMLQHPGIWHKCNGGGLDSVITAFAGCKESTVPSQHEPWCCQDGSRPLQFAQRMHFYIVLCSSAEC